jgi:hypothetical protein
MATEIVLLSTESKYTGASAALREAIPVMELLKEVKEMQVLMHECTANVHCILYEDFSGALEIVQNKQYRPRTKHFLVTLHHFRDYVMQGKVSIHSIRSQDQQADFLTKPVNESMLGKLRNLVQGWQKGIIGISRGSVKILVQDQAKDPKIQ